MVPTASWGRCGNERKRSLPAHVTWSIQGKHSCISLSSVFSCVWDTVLGCRLLLNSLPQKIRPKPSEKTSTISLNSWYVRAWSYFLLHVGCLERSWDDFVHPISFYLFIYKKETPPWMSFGVHSGIELVKTYIGKLFCLLTRLGRCLCPFLEAEM